MVGHRILSPACLPIPPLEQFHCTQCRLSTVVIYNLDLTKNADSLSAFYAERKTAPMLRGNSRPIYRLSLCERKCTPMRPGNPTPIFRHWISERKTAPMLRGN